MGIRRSQIGRGDIARDANWLRPFLPAIGGDTYRVRVSADDTTPDYLEAKVTSADGSVIVAVVNDGADEDLDLSVAVYVAAEIADHAGNDSAHHAPVTQGYGIVVTGQQVAIDTSVIAELADLHSAVTLSTAANANLLSLSGQQIGLDTQSANVIFAGPSSGGAAAPAFRALVDADIPAAIARDSEVTAAIATHAALPNVHHNQVHVLATTTALGPDHTVSGLTSGQVLKATGATAARFVQLLHSELGSIGANDHHNRQHSITSASDHTVTGAALDVVGLSATNTLGILTPSAAVSSATSALLKTDGNGRVQVRGLGINGAPTGDTLYVGGAGTVATLGGGTGNTVVAVDGAAGSVRDYRMLSGGSLVWVVRANDTAQSGSNAGSDFEIRPYSDAAGSLGVAMSIARATSNVSFSAAVSVAGNLSVGGDVTIATNGNQNDRFLMTNSNVSGGAVFYDFNQTDIDGGSTGALEVGFYRDANNVTQIMMSKETFQVAILDGGTWYFPLQVIGGLVVAPSLPTSNPGVFGAFYRSGSTVLIST